MQELHVERTGKGTPVLLIHGLLSNHTQLHPLLPGLHGCELFCIDMLGCGKSGKEPSASIVEDTVAILRPYCKKHGINTVIGYSVGGMVAIELGLRNTILISTFCSDPLVAGPLRMLQGKEQYLEQLLMKYPDRVHAFLTAIRQRKVPGIAQASVPCAINYMMAAKRDYTFQAKMLKRVLVFHGTKDPLIHHSLGEKLAQATRSQIILVPEDHASILKNKIVHERIRAFIAQSH